MINVAANHGVEEIVIGMAHRGRLNVLTNIVGKTYEDIFSEFDGIAPDDFSTGTGDVKYHLGFSGQYDTMDGKEVYVKLLPNPSHLEAINPVVQGYCRAKANAIYQEDYDKILEDDSIDIKLGNFKPNEPVLIILRHKDGSYDEIQALHSYNEYQIEWFKAGSALNLIKIKR